MYKAPSGTRSLEIACAGQGGKDEFKISTGFTALYPCGKELAPWAGQLWMVSASRCPSLPSLLGSAWKSLYCPRSRPLATDARWATMTSLPPSHVHSQTRMSEVSTAGVRGPSGRPGLGPAQRAQHTGSEPKGCNMCPLCPSDGTFFTLTPPYRASRSSPGKQSGEQQVQTLPRSRSSSGV